MFPALSWLCAQLLLIVLLVDDTSAQLDQFSFHPQYWQVSLALHDADITTIMLHRWDGIREVMALDMMLRTGAKNFNFGFIRPEDHVSHTEDPLDARGDLP